MTAQPPQPPPYDAVKLREIVARSDYADLRIFCADLGEDYNAVVGEGKTVREAALAIVKFFDNRGRVAELTARVRKEFPSAEWDAVTSQPAVYVESGGAHRDGSGGAKDVFSAARAPGPLRIFLCHASPDKPAVTELYDRLLAAGFDPWLDRKKIKFGQDWRQAIRLAIENSDLILVCLSNRSLKRDGYLQQEIEDVLNVADRQSAGKIFVIPLRLEDCEVPERIARWHWANYFDQADQTQLFVDLSELAAERKAVAAVALPQLIDKTTVAQALVSAPVTKLLLIDLPKLNFCLELVHIPAGPFMMGDDRYDNEKPFHKVTLPEYWIGKYPITNAQFGMFVQATQYKTVAEKKGSGYVWDGKGWKDTKGANWQQPTGPGSDIQQKVDHPVVHVNWHDAQAFCKWLSEASKRQVVLPSEAEWEKAARGSPASSSDIRAYPWGNKGPDNTLCNFNENEKDTTPVGKYSPKGDSPYGCADVAGNVWEWTRNIHRNYPYDPNDGRELLDVSEVRVVRGGSWFDGVGSVRSASRGKRYNRSVIVGFRVGCVSAPVV